MSHRLREKSVLLQRSVAEGLLVPGDENKLKQLFINLLVNSVEAVLDKGTIQVSGDRADGEVVLTVADNGCGMSPDLYGSIFTPFFTTKTSKSNVGLGLSICQNIVESHGGRISFTSTPGLGTSFTVYLPLAGDQKVV